MSQQNEQSNTCLNKHCISSLLALYIVRIGKKRVGMDEERWSIWKQYLYQDTQICVEEFLLLLLCCTFM